ncbi:FAD/NAD(P)-binding protein [Streptomyces sp. NPDC008139]|uniref:FAD/NAD(P)-binding protein n=1 Tax=Streptomyces sp. NPDC008139 TaxID=3364814 RepID=UPI0036E96581
MNAHVGAEVGGGAGADADVPFDVDVDVDVAFVGGGPRAVSALERLLALHRATGPSPALRVTMIDPYPAGRGRTWRADQSPLLLSNTSVAATTMYPAASAEGPDFPTWIRTEVDGRFPAWVRRDAEGLTPWAQHTRRLQGEYQRWVFRRLAAAAPPHAVVTEIRDSAVDLVTGGHGRSELVLRGGRRVRADVVVLAQGFLPHRPSGEIRELGEAAAAAGLRHLPPGAAAETDWDLVPPGADVLVRGLGPTFFDILGLLFEGRGGRYTGSGRRMRYVPTGREPRLLVGSRAGLPKPAQHPAQVPEPPLTHLDASRTAELLAAHRGRRTLPFAALRPSVLRDIGAAFGAAPWTWTDLHAPTAGRQFASAAHWQAFVDRWAERESPGALDGRPSPWLDARAAVLGVRTVLDELDAAGCFADPASGPGPLAAFHREAGRVTSGPPAVRFAQLLALRRQGLVVLTGPGQRLDVVDGRFRGRSDAVPGAVWHADVAVEAYLAFGALETADDPLMAALLRDGRVRPHRDAPSADTASVGTAPDGMPSSADAATARPATSLDIDPHGWTAVRRDGTADPRLIVLGMPGSAHQRSVGRAGLPQAGDRFFAETEQAARSVLRALPAAAGKARAS